MRSTRLPTVSREGEGAIEDSEPVAEECSHDPEALQVSQKKYFAILNINIVQDTIAPLERHQLLHTRVTGPGAETKKITETPCDLPPSYSLLDIELPDYNDL